MQTFADYMDEALYGPEGYYATGQAYSGREGDYFTAPDVGPAFGQLLHPILRSWQQALSGSFFQVVEIGAGEGALARVLAPEFQYTAVERSPERRKKLAQLGSFPILGDIRQLAPTPVAGCFFANELLDAFPVHRVRMHRGQLQEAYVNGSLVWGEPSTPKLRAYFDRLGLTLPENYETEINLAMADWFRAASEGLSRGLVLLIDYGRPAHEYYDPERSSGTLRAFQNHRVSSDVLQTPGQIDLTADVDFTSAALDAQEAGLTPLAYMELGSFLLPGVESVSASLPAPMAGLKYLIHPEGMGSAFQVLVLGKQVPDITESFFPHNRLQRLGLERIHPCSR